MHLRSKAADMRGLQRQKLLSCRLRKALQLDQVQRIQRMRALGQALLHTHMLQIAVDNFRKLRVLLLKRGLLALLHQYLHPFAASAVRQRQRRSAHARERGTGQLGDP